MRQPRGHLGAYYSILIILITASYITMVIRPSVEPEHTKMPCKYLKTVPRLVSQEAGMQGGFGGSIYGHHDCIFYLYMCFRDEGLDTLESR